MNLKNCPQCGKLFASEHGEKLCPVCLEDEESDFQKVKEFLWDNPKATIEEVHKETGVERDLIIKFIRDDRLIAEGIDIDIVIECERYGKAIAHGRFCKSCQEELIDGLSPTKKKKKKDNQEKKKRKSVKDEMFIKERIKKKKKR